ncbi:glycine betaine ABC transporter substrate-binding protein [Sciscionella marina]|uniref:glycine betaine ABC transporter substrate-binding protein n=1 Tax=Sciscionella marina TaxID=508770 RepID=UPI000368BE47|nr:glycine betaine ABC transporter substrate-binding protein [Sciscionella marina]
MPRKKRVGWFAGLTAMLLAVVMVSTACGKQSTNSQGTGGQDKKINIAYIAWDEDIALSNLYKAALMKAGWKKDDIKLQELDAAPIFQSLSTGKSDLFLDAWLPITHKSYWDQYGKQLEDLGTWYDNATLGLAVPDYVKDVKSIADLKEHAGEFGGQIVGIDNGAGEMKVVREKAMPQYGLDGPMKLSSSSTASMLAAVEKAVNEKKPVVATLWKPHWAYTRYKLHDLEDPKGAMAQHEKIHAVGRKDFGKDFPNLEKSLKGIKLDDKQLGTLEDMVHSAGSNADAQLKAAQQWMDKNPDFVKQHLSNL